MRRLFGVGWRALHVSKKITFERIQKTVIQTLPSHFFIQINRDSSQSFRARRPTFKMEAEVKHKFEADLTLATKNQLQSRFGS
jgi:hypothetical protein